MIKHHDGFFLSLASNLKSGTLVSENLSKCPNKHVKNVHVPGAWTSLESFCEIMPLCHMPVHQHRDENGRICWSLGSFCKNVMG